MWPPPAARSPRHRPDRQSRTHRRAPWRRPSQHAGAPNAPPARAPPPRYASSETRARTLTAWRSPRLRRADAAIAEMDADQLVEPPGRRRAQHRVTLVTSFSPRGGEARRRRRRRRARRHLDRGRRASPRSAGSRRVRTPAQVGACSRFGRTSSSSRYNPIPKLVAHMAWGRRSKLASDPNARRAAGGDVLTGRRAMRASTVRRSWRYTSFLGRGRAARGGANGGKVERDHRCHRAHGADVRHETVRPDYERSRAREDG